MTPIQIFDKVAAHLLRQNAKSFDIRTNSCRYRGDQGRSCAVGCLITDAYYTEDLEGYASYTNDVKWAVADSLGIPFKDVPDILLEQLQNIHDHANPEAWPVLLENLRNYLPKKEFK